MKLASLKVEKNTYFDWENTHILENDLIWSLRFPWTTEWSVQQSPGFDSGLEHPHISPEEGCFSDSRWSSPDEEDLTSDDEIPRWKARNRRGCSLGGRMHNALPGSSKN